LVAGSLSDAPCRGVDASTPSVEHPSLRALTTIPMFLEMFPQMVVPQIAVLLTNVRTRLRLQAERMVRGVSLS
jgi:hypothetical protein